MGDFVIDLNCDTGEGVGNEQDLMPYISSCNIACGGHAGNPDSMGMVVRLAGEYGVQVGAHPAYPDREHFGRRSMVLSSTELQRTIRAQIHALEEVLEVEGMALHHIKAHGALYNDLAANSRLAGDYLRILEPYRGRAALYLPSGSEIAGQAKASGFEVWEEGFADRAYHRDGSLVSRSLEGALLTDPREVFGQVCEIVLRKRVQSVEGPFIPMLSRTLCVHGDTPGALEILMYLSRELPQESIRLPL